MREDYLAHLEGLKGAMPSITQNRMRLARMTGQQALAAVMKPGGKLVTEEVAAAIVRFTAGGSELANAEVEPSLLSLICRELNNARIAKGRAEISADVLAGSRDTILTEFYERALADQPPGVRQVIEDNLLTDSGFRESLAEERVQKAFAAAGAPAGTLATLVDRRLLRIEERLDVRRVELTHDVLCGVVKASRDLRLEREARDEAEKKLAAQRERERATRRALVRARQIAAVCAVLAVVALGSAVFGYFSMKRAQEAEAKAEQTRLLAEQARGEAEKLVVYLLDDFYLELAPVGRLDIVGELAKRARRLLQRAAGTAAHHADRAQSRAGARALRLGAAHTVAARRRQESHRRGGEGAGADARAGRQVRDHRHRPRHGSRHPGATGVDREPGRRSRAHRHTRRGSAKAGRHRAELVGDGTAGLWRGAHDPRGYAVARRQVQGGGRDVRRGALDAAQHRQPARPTWPPRQRTRKRRPGR